MKCLVGRSRFRNFTKELIKYRFEIKINVMTEVVINTKTRGRKVNPNSARQARLAKWNAMREAGMIVRRGRPAAQSLQTEINFDVTTAPAQAQVKVVPISDAVASKLDKAMEMRHLLHTLEAEAQDLEA